VRTPELPEAPPSRKVSVPRRLALILNPLVWLVAIPLGHGAVPWAVSLLTPRHEWTEGRLAPPGGDE
jgi:hypothetical protein